MVISYVFIASADLEQAFDSVRWEEIYNILERARVTFKNKRIIKSLFE